MISYLKKYMSCTYDPGILVYILSVQDKQVQSQRNVRNKSIARAYQPEIWRCMYSKKMASKHEGSFCPKFFFPKFYMSFKFFFSNSFSFDIGKMDLRSNPFKEGGNDAPRIVDSSQNNATMVELNQSDTYLAELDELNTQESWNDIILDELSKLVLSSELVRPPELVWSPDFQPSTMIVPYVPTSEDSRPKVFYQPKYVQERLSLINFTASTKQTSLGREK